MGKMMENPTRSRKRVKKTILIVDLASGDIAVPLEESEVVITILYPKLRRVTAAATTASCISTDRPARHK